MIRQVARANASLLIVHGGAYQCTRYYGRLAESHSLLLLSHALW
jgi:hypothetical protein